MSGATARLAREPVVHFVLIGALIFAAYRLARGGDPPPAPRTIEISAPFVDELAAAHALTRGSLPAVPERDALVDEFVTQEILVREALALGLHRTDPVVRRRLAQKMEFLLEETASPDEPGEAELQAHLAAHGERFRVPAAASFRHVLVRADRPDAEERARRLLADLAEGRADPAAAGDPSLVAASLTLAPRAQVARLWGDGFADRLFEAPPGRWTGPLRSSHGLHLVLVSERREARAASLDEAHAQVRAAVLVERREVARRRALRDLRRAYQVVRAPGEPAGRRE